MLKKVSIESLKPGMFLHDFGLGWMDHPFAVSRFTVKSDDQIAELQALGVREVYIDTEKGLDERDAPTAEAVRAEVDARMKAVADEKPADVHVAVAEEIERAKVLHQRASRVVHDVMKDARLGKAVRIEDVSALVDDITESVVRNSGALLAMLRLKDKDNYTFLHCVSVGTLMVTFGRSLGVQGEDLRQAGIGGFVHDVGKMQIPDAILNKPGKLTDEEFAQIRTHPSVGYDILVRSSNVGEVPIEITRHHHERMDGSGYPDRQPGDRITIQARMAAIVDVYDAITSDRCYHKAMPPTEALRKMMEWSGHFDPALIKQFIRCVGIYPTGTLVRLNSGRLAVVTEQSEGNLLKPRVRAFFSTKSNCYIKPVEVDTARSGSDHIVADEAAEKWGVDPMRFLAAAA